MAAVDASIYEIFTIESSDQSKTVDIREGVVGFIYYENIKVNLVYPSIIFHRLNLQI